MRTTDSLVNIAPDLVLALAEIEGVAKDGANPAFRAGGKPSQYTTLGAVIGASKEILAKHNLGLMQFPGALVDGTLSLETVIFHKSGEWVSGDFQIALGKVDPQGVGSALTYARRYAQKAALNIPDVDDDAEAATDRNGSKSKSAADMAIRLLTDCVDAAAFKEAWAKNAEGWKNLLEVDDLKRVWTVKDEMVAKFKRRAEGAKQQPAPSNDTPFDDDLGVMDGERAA